MPFLQKLMSDADVVKTEIEQANLLIVDDHLDNLRSLSTLLNQVGYRVRNATSGEMALKTIQVELPDLILLDVRMPQMDGYQMCERLKANPYTSKIPIIFLSALHNTDDKVKAFAVGGADYITKPFQAEEVLARVRHQIVILRQQQQLTAQNQQLMEANLKLQQLANLDGLTQIANRRCFDDYLEQEWRRLGRDKQPLALILCDIDSFKSYNDCYGHLAGDTCLQQVVQMIRQSLKRPADLVARYGGEEFAVILPNTNELGAVTITESIQTAIHALRIPHAASKIASYITLSFGVACLTPTPNSSYAVLIAAADAALYRAKQRGRDRYCVHWQPTFN